jgi:hypothetical protein
MAREKYFRNLKQPRFELNGWFAVLPRCDCWKLHPRWTVVRSWCWWWRCADCGRIGKRVLLPERML